ncbi:MAG: hypothetical protein K2J73_11435 [Oscillospiraceae bacterium]|nr:hypothetical protein [Oscillospiraceae bacterium]
MSDSLKLDRELYRKIKGMDKSEMAGFLERIYAMGAEDNKGVGLELLRERIGQVKGIGEARLNEIMGIIEETAITNDDK